MDSLHFHGIHTLQTGNKIFHGNYLMTLNGYHKAVGLKNSRNLAYERTIITVHIENTGINGTLLPVITQ